MRICGSAGSITSIDSAVSAISAAIIVTNSAKRGMARGGAAVSTWVMGGFQSRESPGSV